MQQVGPEDSKDNDPLDPRVVLALAQGAQILSQTDWQH